MAHELPDQEIGNEDLSQLLNKFQPQPSDRFYNRMKNAPWMRKPHRASIALKRGFAFGGLVLILLIVLTLTIPSLRVTAKQFLNFFLPESTDQSSIPFLVPFSGTPQDVNTPGYFDLSLSEAELKVNFKLKTISQVPKGVSVEGVNYDPSLDSITIKYRGENFLISFTQRQTGKILEYQSIGASASVEKVQVRGVEGEYVTGGWRFSSDYQNAAEDATPGLQGTVKIYWDVNLQQQMLRWIEGEMQYEIIYHGDGQFGKNGLIQLANSIQ